MGYQTISLKTGLNLVSTTFDDISGGAADIQDFLSGDFLPNEELLFYKPGGGYDRYLYSDNLMDAAWNDLNRPGWGNMSGQIVTREIKAGDAFWINAKADHDITISGAVKTNTQVISCTAGLNLVASAFPVETDANVALVVDGLRENDQLMVYKQGGGYDRYLYTSNLADADWKDLNRPGWGNMSGQEVAIPLPPNKAFWIYTANPSIEIQIDSPLQ